MLSLLLVDVGETINKRKRERDTGDVGRCVKEIAGIQFTKVKATNGNTTPVSHKKVKYVRRRKEEHIDAFILLDIQIYEDIVSSLVCPECYEKSSQNMNPFDVNIRAVYASRSCGF